MLILSNCLFLFINTFIFQEIYLNIPFNSYSTIFYYQDQIEKKKINLDKETDHQKRKITKKDIDIKFKARDVFNHGNLDWTTKKIGEENKYYYSKKPMSLEIEFKDSSHHFDALSVRIYENYKIVNSISLFLNKKPDTLDNSLKYMEGDIKSFIIKDKDNISQIIKDNLDKYKAKLPPGRPLFLASPLKFTFEIDEDNTLYVMLTAPLFKDSWLIEYFIN